MKVRDLMTSNPTTCGPTDTVATALSHMWEDDCGILPVVESGNLVGVVTDRDLAMALLFEGAPPKQIQVGSVMQLPVHTCWSEDDAVAALEIMAEHRVRRLPVIENGRLAGLVSLNDVALEARASHGGLGRPTYGDVTKALQRICEHHQLPVSA